MAMAMARARARVSLLVSCSFFLCLLAFAPSPSLVQAQTGNKADPSPSWSTVRSLFTSLLHRILNLRLSRGDASGAERISQMLSTFDSSLLFWKKAGSLGWDYLVHYYWRRVDPTQIMGILKGINEIQSFVAELLQLSSANDRLNWISLNYTRILRLSKDTLRHLLSVLDQPGALRNFILSLQTEIVSGDVLRDALELGAADLHGIFQVAKELLGRYYRSSYTNNSSEL